MEWHYDKKSFFHDRIFFHEPFYEFGILVDLILEYRRRLYVSSRRKTFNIFINIHLSGVDEDLKRKIDSVQKSLISLGENVLFGFGFQCEIHAPDHDDL